MKTDGINPGGTHFPILAAALERSEGGVVECGVGDYSTPLLHFLCARTKRPLVSIDNDEAWLLEFKLRHEELPWHRFHHEPDWRKMSFTPSERPVLWPGLGVAFIDCAPGADRPWLALNLRDRVKFVVAHDTEAYGDGWPAIKGIFKYETVWKQYPTWTTVYSNFEEFKL